MNWWKRSLGGEKWAGLPQSHAGGSRPRPGRADAEVQARASERVSASYRPGADSPEGLCKRQIRTHRPRAGAGVLTAVSHALSGAAGAAELGPHFRGLVLLIVFI